MMTNKSSVRPSHGSASSTVFNDHLHSWNLSVDGEAIVTRSAHLLPVRWRGQPAMLKICVEEEERSGAAVMAWWGGDGAAPVFAHDATALVMSRATGPNSLDAMARTEHDDEACRILCAVAARLHAPRAVVPPDLVALERWFCALQPAAARYGGMLVRCAETARALLAEPRDIAVLHGDLHHNNVLDFAEDSWLAIDPKGLVGERGFDVANIFTNPDLADPNPPVATEPARFRRRLDIVTEAAGLERTRLLRWILAWTGLSAAWFLDDGDPAAIDLRIAELAAIELDRESARTA